MLYESTRGSINKKTGAQAVIQGIAEDKGLYVPVEMPKLPISLGEIPHKSYKELAKLVIGAFFDDFTPEEVEACVEGAYDHKFTAEDKVEMQKAGGAYFLQLYHGKTAAFKDMALSILPYLMTASLKKQEEKDKICILTATSGDTGKAALEGFADVEGTEIIVFYPGGGVSKVQERQMVSQEGKNTHVFAIDGNFDDAQTGVKKIFGDEKLKEELKERGIKLSSANSINIGRLVPQVVYYVYAYGQLIKRGALKEGEPMNVSVPTGNFGNILAAYFAGEMGVPIGKFICASNENKVLTDFFKNELYDIRPATREFHLTNSPSMDILISSNLERLLYLAGGRDGELVRNWMDSLEYMKFYTVMDSEVLQEALKAFYGGFATEKEALNTIKELWEQEHYLSDTHTAVAYKVYKDYLDATGDETPTVVVSTASPYKFAEAVGKALAMDALKDGFEAVRALEEKTGVEVPYGLQDLDKKPVLHKDKIESAGMWEAVKKSLE